MRTLFFFILFSLSLLSFAAPALARVTTNLGANTCPAISEGTYQCLTPKSQKPTTVTVVKGSVESGPALKMLIDDIAGDTSDGIPCMNGQNSSVLCGVDQRVNPLMAAYCSEMGPYAIVIDKAGTSNAQALTFHVKMQHIPISNGLIQTVADYTVGVTKKSPTSFEFAVSGAMSGGQRTGTSICTKE